MFVTSSLAVVNRPAGFRLLSQFISVTARISYSISGKYMRGGTSHSADLDSAVLMHFDRVAGVDCIQKLLAK